METPASIIEELYERAEAYGKTSYEIAKLKTLETVAVTASSLLSRLGVAIMIILFVLILNIGIALWLGDLLGKSYYGFFVVATFYLVAWIVFHFYLHKWIKTPVSNLIIKQALQ
jgi:hypothetical protein